MKQGLNTIVTYAISELLIVLSNLVQSLSFTSLIKVSEVSTIIYGLLFFSQKLISFLQPVLVLQSPTTNAISHSSSKSKHKKELLMKIKTWSKSSHVYTCRFGIEALMSHYLDKDFKAEYLEIPASVRSEEYYVKMMVAWFFATALAKQWDQAIPYIMQHRLAPWTHNKTIQKAIESYRITPEQKEYLRTLRIK